MAEAIRIVVIVQILHRFIGIMVEHKVFRKHLELLTLAGVDYLVFDYTNSGMSGGETKPHNFYSDVTDELFPVAAEMKSQGWNIPKFVFMLNHNSDITLNMPTCLVSLNEDMGVTVRPNASVALKLRIVFDDDKVISSDSGNRNTCF